MHGTATSVKSPVQSRGLNKLLTPNSSVLTSTPNCSFYFFPNSAHTFSPLPFGFLVSMPRKTSICLCGFIVFNILLACWRIVVAMYLKLSASETPDVIDYTGINYPQILSLPPSEAVAMSLHETWGFSLSPNDSLGDAEWSTILYYAQEGRVQLGAERRAFIPSYFHQFHCLRGLQRSIVFPGRHDDVNVLKAPDDHVQHCLNYLRQTLLCNPAHMLEKGDFMASSFEPGTLGSDLVCQDWAVLFDEMNRQHDEFLNWNDDWN